MKILAVCCSPRSGGNTEILMKEALRGAKESGATTELLSIAKMDIKPCQACGACRKTGECSIQDDMQKIYPKLLEADGIIFGVPVYILSMCAQAKIVLDRTYALGRPYLKLANKVGGIITVASSHGVTGVIQEFTMYFVVNHMISADWVFGYARTKGSIKKNKHAMVGSYELGRQVVALVHQKFSYPQEFKLPMYWFLKEKYDIDPCPFEN